MNTQEGYALHFEGHGTFTPEGRTNNIADINAHNRQLEENELDVWSRQPQRFYGYVDRPVVGSKFTTWLGNELGTIIHAASFRSNWAHGNHITSIRIRGTNGATYYGRYGSDWSPVLPN